MTTGTRPFRFAALLSFALILPFIVIQATVGGVGRAGIPGIAVLFGLLWLLPTVSIGSSLRILRPPARTGRMTPGTRFLLSAALVLAAAAVWGILLAGQLPCFLGVPNCE